MNLSIADRTSEQVTPKVAVSPAGGIYVAWFDLASGNYDVYLQRLDGAGFEQWPHNGILVSAHPQDSWLMDWDLTADSAGNAVVTFTDIRAGGDTDVMVYKVSPAGDMLWGANGIALSINADFDTGPRVVEASDGDIVVAWSTMPDVGDGHLMMQRLAPDGTPRFAAGGISIATGTGELPGFCSIIAGAGGNVIVSWIRDTSYYGDRSYRAEAFTAGGVSAWGGPVEVYDAGPLPIAYHPGLLSDGAGGAVLYWHRASGLLYSSFVQRLDTAGLERFPHNGVEVSTRAGVNHIDPTVSFDRVTGDLYIFWDERNSNQDEWGTYGQRIDAAGARLWTNNGHQFQAMNSTLKWFYRALPAPGGAMCFWFDQPGGYGNDRVVGIRVDEAANYVWADGIIDVASTLSGKGRLPVVQQADGSAVLIWEDDRAGTVDVYGQSVNLDGTLGSGGTAVEAAGALRARLQPNYPNPFNPTTTLVFTLKQSANALLTVHDPAGRQVAVLLDGFMAAGAHSLVWDGRDERGDTLPSGVYLARLSAGGETMTRPMVLLK